MACVKRKSALIRDLGSSFEAFCILSQSEFLPSGTAYGVQYLGVSDYMRF